MLAVNTLLLFCTCFLSIAMISYRHWEIVKNIAVALVGKTDIDFGCIATLDSFCDAAVSSGDRIMQGKFQRKRFSL